MTRSDSSSDNEEAKPYNPKNVTMTAADLQAFLTPYGVPGFKNINLYQCAMVHKSYCTRKNENFVDGNTDCPPGCLPLQEESYEVLEFEGDAILNKVVALYLVKRYPKQNEGFYTRTRTKLVNGKMLAKLSKEIGFGPFMLISQQIEDSDGRNISNILEDVLEAFIGALYEDQGDDASRDWIINMLESHVDFAELIRMNTNYKDTLIKYMQAAMGYAPKFIEADVAAKNGSNHKVYKVYLKSPQDHILAVGTGSSKKDAENDAARAALAQMKPEALA